MKQVSKEELVRIYESGLWQDWDSHQKVEFQLFQNRLSMPFAVFHEAIEKELGRPVYTHEFGLDMDGLRKEFLGEREPPTIEQIIELIPSEKRLIIFTDELNETEQE